MSEVGKSASGDGTIIFLVKTDPLSYIVNSG